MSYEGLYQHFLDGHHRRNIWTDALPEIREIPTYIYAHDHEHKEGHEFGGRPLDHNHKGLNNNVS